MLKSEIKSCTSVTQAAKNGEKPTSLYDVTHNKTETQNHKFFFIADLNTCQVF